MDWKKYAKIGGGVAAVAVAGYLIYKHEKSVAASNAANASQANTQAAIQQAAMMAAMPSLSVGAMGGVSMPSGAALETVPIESSNGGTSGNGLIQSVITSVLGNGQSNSSGSSGSGNGQGNSSGSGSGSTSSSGLGNPTSGLPSNPVTMPPGAIKGGPLYPIDRGGQNNPVTGPVMTPQPIAPVGVNGNTGMGVNVPIHRPIPGGPHPVAL